MKKYDKKIIYDYIMGNDLGEYSSEELEDNKEFMIEVIEKTNDKRMYNLCSNNVSLDYEFVKYIVLKFRNDVDFIKEVADNYLNNIGVDNDYERVELLAIMSSLTNSYDYNFMLDAVYSSKRLSIELYNVKNKDNNDDTLYNIMNEGGELSEDSIKSTLELAPNEVFYYNAVKKMMMDTIYGKDNNNNDDDNKPNTKVLKIKFRQE